MSAGDTTPPDMFGTIGRHLGHKIAAHTYGDRSRTIECADCGVVIIDADTTDTTTHDPVTEVVYAADVVVQFWPDGPPTAQILFRQDDPLVMWGDGSGGVDDATIKADAIAACGAALRDPMPLPLGGRARQEDAR